MKNITYVFKDRWFLDIYFNFRDITYFLSMRSVIMFNVLVVDDGSQTILYKNNYVTQTVTCK